jgi:general stress protein YciG
MASGQLKSPSWHLGCTRLADGSTPRELNPGYTRRREEDNVAKEDRGFASMDRAKQREIASKGGKAAHQKGTAHEWTSEEARDAGRKGGIASHQRRREQSGGPNSEADEMPALGSDDSRRNSSSSESSSSMDSSREDHAQRDDWSRDE